MLLDGLHHISMDVTVQEEVILVALYSSRVLRSFSPTSILSCAETALEKHRNMSLEHVAARRAAIP
jgi:hypothetical protein